MKPEIDYSLYLVTDRALMSTPTLEQAVEQAIEKGGPRSSSCGRKQPPRWNSIKWR